MEPRPDIFLFTFDGPPDGLFGDFEVPVGYEEMGMDELVAAIRRLNPGCDHQTALQVWNAVADDGITVEGFDEVDDSDTETLAERGDSSAGGGIHLFVSHRGARCAYSVLDAEFLGTCHRQSRWVYLTREGGLPLCGEHQRRMAAGAEHSHSGTVWGVEHSPDGQCSHGGCPFCDPSFDQSTLAAAAARPADQFVIQSIPTPQLRPDHIPSADGDLDDFGPLWRFAASFNGYEWWGGDADSLGEFAAPYRATFCETGRVPDLPLNPLRALLFWQYRRCRWQCQELMAGESWERVHPRDAAYTRALVERVSRLVAGLSH